MVANLEMHPSCPLIGPDVVDGVSEVSGGAVVNRVGVVGLLVGGGRRWACTSAAKKQATIEIRFTHIIATSYCLLTAYWQDQCYLYTEIISGYKRTPTLFASVILKPYNSSYYND